ncbi:hypothetical protein OEB99_12910 [Actinotalea sp. M2MS4P-6]|uniref:hypothetical protein n=1 Tax=Actinotalea sp. M2MS4P-6 TaxID=2983762 RepID=UPI0021E47780|nr:hypothetical protein [Actinotalea sp. M2MS4P-6]MCV2395211.1 hypothetical protein [Actinotalea sp. M2MS4P-6]
MSLQTRYDFTLPRGYVDGQGVVHRTGTMRLATARDELEPLRDPTIDGADDPRLTVVVLARVVERLGTLDLVTTHEIEGLFAADLAFLQDFYGVINFGTQAEYEELVAAQREAEAPVTSSVSAPASPPAPTVSADAVGSDTGAAPDPTRDLAGALPRPGRSAIEEIPRDGR